MQSLSKREQDIIEKIRHLQPHQVWEVEDFIDFLSQRSRNEPTREEFIQLSEAAFARVWDNSEDSAYDNL
ncbi:toxin-antitoxin system, antitoxin component, Xre family protein [Synechococcales cyanobacterium C]|uniref:Toxin-antitoxin system, antitoxin component, Xre family protein n=1 Tax=Petrachloros mirabilis ULC683 TaxID=2781853 RepID=A0A8K1ZWE4_9CYAN|nr:toxin-antitoxin system, antitoxin component, Xre family protein [Petrachloros mirabilis]NCJ05356.1 toxin-antitoxin system, antitoxin component, Xre family protein [Petrachloros mirabilis ULC683]